MIAGVSIKVQAGRNIHRFLMLSLKCAEQCAGDGVRGDRRERWATSEVDAYGNAMFDCEIDHFGGNREILQANAGSIEQRDFVV